MFVHPWGLLLLVVAPGCYWLYRFAAGKRAEALRRFSVSAADSGRGGWWWIPIVCALTLLCLAIARPLGGTRGGAGNRAPDVVFLLDVSRSMGTQDGSESRIELARSAIRAIMDRGADQRFGLVVFSGNASLECPLTNDYVFLRAQLRAASRESVTVGGTRLGDAIQFASQKAFDDASRNPRELVLISDGGDEGSSSAEAAHELEKRGIRLVVAGVGDRSTRATVPESEVDASPILYEGRSVTAPLDEDVLQKICKASARCTYAGLPSIAFEETVLDQHSLFAWSGANAGSVMGAVLALGAAILLAGENLVRRFAR